MTEDVDK